ncbi:zinc finger protein 99-like isoform X10 [Ostrinia nubilalis]|uniref:zinc finger protein 99-like isoform X10 n=1 Tax=Ostrinia nubilalis TaxID=29057 RepID=UPI00308244E4
MEFDEIVVKESPGLCRCCLSEGCYKDLGTEYTWMNENEVYADMLLECFDISISQHNEGPNGPSRLICEVCITRLRDACNFKKQVLDSEKKFVDMIGRGDFRPKVMIYQSQMKAEASEETPTEDTEVEYLDEMDFGDADDEPLKNEASGSDIAVEALPLPKRGRPPKARKAVKGEKKKTKAEDRPKASKTIVKDNRMLKRQKKLDLAQLITTIVTKSTLMPFRWHGGKYMCFYCCTHFVDSSKLREHQETHPDVDINEILLRTVYKESLFRIKLDVTEIWCTECPEELQSFEEYIEHLSTHHDITFEKAIISRCELFKLTDEVLNCLQCEETFNHFGHLLNHIHQSHIDVDRHKFLCEICGQGFADKWVVATHIKHVHRLQQCKYCPEVFQTQYAMDKHVGTVHKTEKFKCPMCPKILPTRYMKKRHLAMAHDCKSAQLTCDLCGVVFTRNNKLMMHKKRVHFKEKNVACDVCGGFFFDADSLKKHQISHSQDKPFQCDICPKSFKRKSGLAMHISQCHATEEKADNEDV